MNYTFEDLKNKTIIITGGSGFWEANLRKL